MFAISSCCIYSLGLSLLKQLQENKKKADGLEVLPAEKIWQETRQGAFVCVWYPAKCSRNEYVILNIYLHPGRRDKTCFTFPEVHLKADFNKIVISIVN